MAPFRWAICSEPVRQLPSAVLPLHGLRSIFWRRTRGQSIKGTFCAMNRYSNTYVLGRRIALAWSKVPERRARDVGAMEESGKER